MKTKIGGGGRLQNYDSHGRYAKTIYEPARISKKEKNKIREDKRINDLWNRANESNDKYLFEIFEALENEFPKFVSAVNVIRFDELKKKNREFDIIGSKSIIEIKSGTAEKCVTQFKAQQDYANRHNKNYYVYAPNISKTRKNVYAKMGFNISCSIDELIAKIKEKRK